MIKSEMNLLNRRRALALLGGVGVSALLGPASEDAEAQVVCVPVAAQQTEGPYWVEENLNRTDIRVDPSDGSVKPGVLLALSITVRENSGSDCTPLAGAHVNLWHCDAAGLYSDVAANGTVGKKFLRGYQVTDDNGNAQFTTIYPGWYNGRAIHIHVRIRTYSGSQQLDQFTAQLFFDDTLTDQVFTQPPYNTRRARDTRNSNDMVLTGTRGTVLFPVITKTALGYSGTVEIGVNLKTPTVSKAVISSKSVVSSASLEPGISPGAWITIFGQNLAASTHTVSTADLVSGVLPTTLSGVAVTIDNKPAFIQYVSPTQINVQAPADSNSGNVQVTVTNASGTSDPVTTILQPLQPAFFTSQKYVAALRSDGTIITGSHPAKPGDVLSLYGTGFGPTDPAIEPGTMVQTAAQLTETPHVTIGGATAPVSFAGLSATGLDQINVTVPSLSDGDHEVTASIGGVQSKSGVLLKTQS
jgi:uncharacterized protein (TIGR03437 family)